jgi:sphinganine-1-phosphate aldolase
LHGSSVARYITSNTVVVVASAPGFPHGVVDDVSGIAAAAAKRGVLCHVDACLGGYLLPFVEQLGYDVPTFDFRVPGEGQEQGNFGFPLRAFVLGLFLICSLRTV